MKTTILKILIIAIIVISPALAMNYAMLHIKNKIGFEYEYLDKLNILKETTARKIVLVGGSNLIFGVNSTLLEDSLHVKVINTGLHGELALKFPIETVKQYLKPEDVMVLVLEYDNFKGNFWLGEDYLSNVVATDYSRFIPYLDRHQLFLCEKNFFRTSFKNFAAEYTGKHDPSYYRRTDFDQKGDYTGHLNKPGKPFIPVTQLDTLTFNDEVIAYLDSISTELKKKNVTFLIGFPPLLNKGYEAKKPFIEFVLRKLRKDQNIQLVGDPKDYIFTGEQIFDREYHLNKFGRDARTIQFLHDLETVLYPPLLSNSQIASPPFDSK